MNLNPDVLSYAALTLLGAMAILGIIQFILIVYFEHVEKKDARREAKESVKHITLEHAMAVRLEREKKEKCRK